MLVGCVQAARQGRHDRILPRPSGLAAEWQPRQACGAGRAHFEQRPGQRLRCQLIGRQAGPRRADEQPLQPRPTKADIGDVAGWHVHPPRSRRPSPANRLMPAHTCRCRRTRSPTPRATGRGPCVRPNGRHPASPCSHHPSRHRRGCAPSDPDSAKPHPAYGAGATSDQRIVSRLAMPHHPDRDAV